MKNLMFYFIFFIVTQGFSNFASADFFNSDGINIFYSDENDGGIPIVLIHGHTMSSEMWYQTGIAAKLSEKYRVITIDCRGHGKSDKPHDPEDYGPKIGIDVINLLNHLEIKNAHLVGHSMGAFMVGRLLVTHPDRIKTAMMVSGYFPTSDEDELVFQEHTAKGFDEHGDHALAAVARGWKYDAVTDEQISEIKVPVQAVFGSEEIDDFFESQKERFTMPKSSLPIIVIDGADHASEKAAILHPVFFETLEKLIQQERHL